ncbi:MAG: hypothetical protein HUU50_02035 [Candidatus Brocadiae bacterium]|nr:hypothetical protein [Candidatus Brocadiia bacterium]
MSNTNFCDTKDVIIVLDIEGLMDKEKKIKIEIEEIEKEIEKYEKNNISKEEAIKEKKTKNKAKNKIESYDFSSYSLNLTKSMYRPPKSKNTMKYETGKGNK